MSTINGLDLVKDSVKIVKKYVVTLVLNSGSRLDSRPRENQYQGQDLIEKIFSK